MPPQGPLLPRSSTLRRPLPTSALLRPALALLLGLLTLATGPGPRWQAQGQGTRRRGGLGVFAAATAETALGGQGGSGGGGSTGSYIGYSALCVVGKDETRYVREWVEYHKCLGFSRIYLYDHGSSPPMATQIPDHIASGFVVLTNLSTARHSKFRQGYTSDLERFMATAQGQAYSDCVSVHGPRHTFLGFIDLDEFLVLYDQSVRNVDELLRDYESAPGLSIYWVHLGSSGHVARPPGGVVDSYTACTPHNHKFNTQFKTFANTRFRPTMYSPHRATFASPPDPVTGLEPYMVDEHHRRIARGRNKNCTHDRAAVYHYVTKSLEDFRGKMRRGGGAGVTRPKYFFELMDRHCTATCDGALRTRSRFCGVPMPQLLPAAAGGRGGPRGSLAQAHRAGTAP